MTATWEIVGPLYEDHPRWVAYAASVVGPADAEDLVHDAYMRVAEAGDRIREPEKVLTTVIRNLGIDRIRAIQEDPVDPSKVPGSLDPSPPLSIEGAMFVTDFNESLTKLTDLQQKVFILVQLRGLEESEVAELLGVTRQAVSATYHRARRALARELQ